MARNSIVKPRANRQVERGNEIWRLRHEEYLTQRQIAERLGISQQRVSAVLAESGRDLPPRTREGIALARWELLRDLIDTAVDDYYDARTPSAKAMALRGLRGLLSDEREMLGLNAPATVNVNALGPGGEDTTVAYVLEMPDEIRKAIE